MSFENIKKSIQVLWKNKSYLFLAIVIAFGSGLLFYLLSSFSMLIYMGSLSYLIFSLGLSILISIFFGIDISLIIYKFNLSKEIGLKENSSSILGMVGGAVGSGCPICGATIIGLLGVSGGLAALPFKGVGLKVLSLGLILFATYKVSESLFNCKECKTRK